MPNEENYGFKTSLSYRISLRPAWAIQQEQSQKKEKNNKIYISIVTYMDVYNILKTGLL